MWKGEIFISDTPRRKTNVGVIKERMCRESYNPQKIYDCCEIIFLNYNKVLFDLFRVCPRNSNLSNNARNYEGRIENFAATCRVLFLGTRSSNPECRSHVGKKWVSGHCCWVLSYNTVPPAGSGLTLQKVPCSMPMLWHSWFITNLCKYNPAWLKPIQSLMM